MKKFIVKVYPSKIKLKKQNQLAWKLAQVASDKAPLNEAAIEMVVKTKKKNSKSLSAGNGKNVLVKAKRIKY